MEYPHAVVTVGNLTLAVILVEPALTYGNAGDRVLFEAAKIYPTLPTLLITPREGGFSRSYATFNLDRIICKINASTISWTNVQPNNIDSSELPF